jgi:hypothetical protein
MSRAALKRKTKKQSQIVYTYSYRLDYVVMWWINGKGAGWTALLSASHTHSLNSHIFLAGVWLDWLSTPPNPSLSQSLLFIGLRKLGRGRKTKDSLWGSLRGPKGTASQSSISQHSVLSAWSIIGWGSAFCRQQQFFLVSASILFLQIWPPRLQDFGSSMDW